jgi:hypothetical protein
MCAKGHRRHDAEGAATPAPQRPEQIRVPVGVGHDDLAISGHDLEFQDISRCGPVMLGEAAESSALREAPGRSDGQAAASLNVPAAGRDRLVRLQPASPGADRDRRDPALGVGGRAGRRERVMHGDLAHSVRPHEQGSRGPRAPQVVMPGPLDRQPYAAVAGEADGGGDVSARLHRDRAGAGDRLVGLQPSGRVVTARLVLDPIGIAQPGQRRRAVGTGALGEARLRRRPDHRQQPVPELPGQCGAVFGVDVPCHARGPDRCRFSRAPSMRATALPVL